MRFFASGWALVPAVILAVVIHRYGIQSTKAGVNGSPLTPLSRTTRWPDAILR